MSKESMSKIEAWLRDFFKDFGNLAVAVASMGKFKTTETNEETTLDDELEKKPITGKLTTQHISHRGEKGVFGFPPHARKSDN